MSLEVFKLNAVKIICDFHGASALSGKKMTLVCSYLEWISKKTEIIENEKYFVMPSQPYKNGDVVWFEFGFNIDTEFGGRHPALILKSLGKNLIVVPLSSQKPANPNSKIHVHVPTVYGFAKMDRWCNILQIRSASIQRIVSGSNVGDVKGTVLNNIAQAVVDYWK